MSKLSKILSTGVGFVVLMALFVCLFLWHDVVVNTPESSVWHQPVHLVSTLIVAAMAMLFSLGVSKYREKAKPQSEWDTWHGVIAISLGIASAVIYCAAEVAFDFRAGHWAGSVAFGVPVILYCIYIARKQKQPTKSPVESAHSQSSEQL